MCAQGLCPGREEELLGLGQADNRLRITVTPLQSPGHGFHLTPCGEGVAMPSDRENGVTMVRVG